VEENSITNTTGTVMLAASVPIPVAEIDTVSATEQSQRTRDENGRVVGIGDGSSMGHRASTRTPPPADAIPGAGTAFIDGHIVKGRKRTANPVGVMKNGGVNPTVAPK
jgi:hypothetical protein